MFPLMPIFDTDHGMPLSTIQGIHHHQVEAIFSGIGCPQASA
jgi:hypothetical protein